MLKGILSVSDPSMPGHYAGIRAPIRRLPFDPPLDEFGHYRPLRALLRAEIRLNLSVNAWREDFIFSIHQSIAFSACIYWSPGIIAAAYTY